MCSLPDDGHEIFDVDKLLPHECALQKQTAVTAYFSSKQLMLFATARPKWSSVHGQLRAVKFNHRYYVPC